MTYEALDPKTMERYCHAFMFKNSYISLSNILKKDEVPEGTHELLLCLMMMYERDYREDFGPINRGFLG